MDRGRERCPCILMEAGQCYTCTMSRIGKCSCNGSWQGTCPYNEFVQNGSKPVDGSNFFEAAVEGVTEYSDMLKVVRLKVSTGFAQKCREPGSYIMVKSLEYKVPLSVLRTAVKGGAGESFVELAIQPAGPKTKKLFMPGKACWEIGGPLCAGLTNVEKLDFSRPVSVIGKGTAITPYINIGERLSGEIFVDDEKLGRGFLEKYLGDREYTKISLATELEKAAEIIDRSDQIIFLASPYYTEKILEMRPERKSDIITANHANICCGLGICGACSYTDKDGVTVRRCKITER
ncbi:MAG: hypothetical protein IKW01_01430 [Firmicutes bacterium]|nr:hypothetical protein [Bacillota bacterium]